MPPGIACATSWWWACSLAGASERFVPAKRLRLLGLLRSLPQRSENCGGHNRGRSMPPGSRGSLASQESPGFGVAAGPEARNSNLLTAKYSAAMRGLQPCVPKGARQRNRRPWNLGQPHRDPGGAPTGYLVVAPAVGAQPLFWRRPGRKAFTESRYRGAIDYQRWGTAGPV